MPPSQAETVTLDATGAALSCVVGSIFLILLFYFFDHVAWILILS